MAISSKLLNDGEHVVVSTRTHPKALILPLLVLVVLLAIGVAALVVVDSRPTHGVVWVLVMIGAIWFFVRPLVVWASATYTVTNRRLITRRGVITRRGHDIPLSRISDVEYEMGPIDRMLGCGTLKISDASTDGEVTLFDIPHVEDFQRRLNELLHAGDSGSRDGRGD
ncbi:PH domain-containing protein [Nocardioides sp. Iso805N]|uniref:PH domain-containing protein n=1 Tax=Nocardioides sp. Iso805N TaxID=1283287 RepID=UPI0003804AE5|nr:PH domain-containing protein [Nocardioides sp. Iso805N]